jgi:hypothetical protein
MFQTKCFVTDSKTKTKNKIFIEYNIYSCILLYSYIYLLLIYDTISSSVYIVQRQILQKEVFVA